MRTYFPALIAVILTVVGCGGPKSAEDMTPEQAKAKLREMGMAPGPMSMSKFVGKGDMETVKLFIQAGADINKEMASGSDVLMTALQANQPEIALYLLKQGATVRNDARHYGVTHLTEAVQMGNVEVVRIILERGGDPNYVNESQSKMPLVDAAYQGNLEVIQLLLSHDANVDGHPALDSTPLSAAAGKGFLEIVNYLLQEGANPNARGMDGSTAIMAAAGGGHEGIVNVLLERGANPNARNAEGYTALEYAERGQYTALIEKLAALKNDFEGTTPGEEREFLRMKFAWIPGNPRSAEPRLRKGFWMGKYEVTQGEWQRIMDKNPSAVTGDRLPVTNVSWDDCKAFVAKLNKEGVDGTFRIPTYQTRPWACRAAGSGQPPFAFDGDPDKLAQHAWFSANSGGEPHEVGQKPPNAWGLHDMYGNVAEWVGYPPNTETAGGSYADTATDCTDANLGHDERLPTVGLRLSLR